MTSHYCYTYFGGSVAAPEDDQTIKLAVSDDGLRFSAVNDNRPVLRSVLGERGVRDPYLLQRNSADKSGRPKFVMLGTDLDFWNPRYASDSGDVDWAATVRRGSTGICVWESDDLIRWSAERIVDIASSVRAGNMWAPRAIWDPSHGDHGGYLVYWSSCTAVDDYAKQRIWACWTSDFVDFGKPFVYLEKPFAVIDCSMVRYRDVVLRFTKNEDEKYVFLEASSTLFGDFHYVPQHILESHRGGYEGPDAHMLPDGRMVVFVDEYVNQRRGYIPFVADDPLRANSFQPMEVDEYVLPEGGNHGTIMPLTAAEYEMLAALM